MKPRYPLFRLTEDLELILFLLREQLRNRKFFNSLSAIGFSDSFYQSHFDSVILRMLEMDDGSDEIFNFYFSVIDKYCLQVEGDNESLMRAAMGVYGELVLKKSLMVKV